MARITQQDARHLCYRQNVRHQTGLHRAARHAIELGRFWRLDQHDAAIRHDFSQAQRAITPGAGQDDTDGTFALILPQ